MMTTLQYASSKPPLLVTRRTLIEYVYGVCHTMSGVTEPLLYLGNWEAFKDQQRRKKGVTQVILEKYQIKHISASY